MNITEPNWYALYTRARHEKRICTYLSQRGIDSFLPMTTQIRQWSDRKKKVELPLFPNYVFVNLANDHFWKVNDLPGAIRLLGIGKKPSQVPHNVIQSLQKVKDDVIAVDDLNLYKGERVKIASGKFMGVEGEFIRKGGRNILAIGVELMNRVVIVELESNQIQRMQMLNNKRAFVDSCSDN